MDLQNVYVKDCFAPWNLIKKGQQQTEKSHQVTIIFFVQKERE